MGTRALPALGMILLAAATAAQAQDGYLFREQSGLLTLRGGYSMASAHGDVYSFVEQNLTLGRSDFNAVTGGFDFAFTATRRMDVSFGLGFTAATAGSEFRDYVDNNNLPIEQTTLLKTVPLTTTLRYYLAPRGRSLGRYAWVPAHVAPYVGLGGGMLWYTFRQSGDFVDFQTLAVFHDDLTSSGRTLMGLAVAGANVAMGTRWALTGEARYTLAHAPLRRDFVGFRSIDLSGLSFTGGISLRLSNRGVR